MNTKRKTRKTARRSRAGIGSDIVRPKCGTCGRVMVQRTCWRGNYFQCPKCGSTADTRVRPYHEQIP